LCARRARLHVREVEDTNAVQCFTHSMLPPSLVHGLVLGARRVLARVDPDIDHR
jgi:hypothetical protein